MSRNTKILGFSVSPGMAKEYDQLAKEEKKTKSELFRDMVALYQQYREKKEFFRLQAGMAKKASELGIRNEKDVERLIHEVRGV